MGCKEVRELLGPFADDELVDAERQQVEEHIAQCGECAAELTQFETLRPLLRDAVMEPAILAEANGRFDDLWANIEAELQPRPTPEPTFWRRIQEWWDGLFEQRQAWLPAAAAAGVLAVMVGILVANNDGTAPGGEGVSPAGPAVAVAPAGELPPYADPKIAPEAIAKVDDNGTVKPAPRRRGLEEAVARNEVFITDYAVDRGIVMIDQDPNEPDMPVVVWHILPDEAETNEDSI